MSRVHAIKGRGGRESSGVRRRLVRCSATGTERFSRDELRSGPGRSRISRWRHASGRRRRRISRPPRLCRGYRPGHVLRPGHHERPMGLIAKPVGDSASLKLIRAFLSAGGYGAALSARRRGHAAGGPLSPLLERFWTCWTRAGERGHPLRTLRRYFY